MSEDKSDEYRKLLLLNTGLSLKEIEQKVIGTIARMKGLITEETALYILIKEYNIEQESEKKMTEETWESSQILNLEKKSEEVLKGNPGVRLHFNEKVMDTNYTNIFVFNDWQKETNKTKTMVIGHTYECEFLKNSKGYWELKRFRETSDKPEAIHIAAEPVTKTKPTSNAVATPIKQYLYMTEDELKKEYETETYGQIHGHIENILYQRSIVHILSQIRDTAEKQYKMLGDTFAKIHTDAFDIKQAVLETKTHLENYEKLRGTVDDCLRKTIDLTKTVSKQKTAKKTAEATK